VQSAFLSDGAATLVEFIPCGARGNPEQDSYLVRKRG